MLRGFTSVLDTDGMPDTIDCERPYWFYMFSYDNSSSQIRPTKRLTTMINNAIGSLKLSTRIKLYKNDLFFSTGTWQVVYIAWV